jgi:proton-dependent oligopeptide transporter, POT family
MVAAVLPSRCHWGTVISGELPGFYTAENEGTYFGALGGMAVGIGALLAVASPWVLKLMRGMR